MKVWTNYHVIDHPWEKVAPSILQKYPNPFNNSVKTMDVLERSVDKDGVLKSHRILGTNWSIPDIFKRFVFGSSEMWVGCEHITVDPKTKSFKQQTKNVTLSNVASLQESYHYRQHPEDPSKTLLECEYALDVFPIYGFRQRAEQYMQDKVTENAVKGLEGLNWVIGQLHPDIAINCQAKTS